MRWGWLVVVVVEVILLGLGEEIVLVGLGIIRGLLGGHGHGAVGVLDVWRGQRACQGSCSRIKTVG